MKYRKGHLYRAKCHLLAPSWDEAPDTDYGQLGSFHLCLGTLCQIDGVDRYLVQFFSLERGCTFSMILGESEIFFEKVDTD